MIQNNNQPQLNLPELSLLLFSNAIRRLKTNSLNIWWKWYCDISITSYLEWIGRWVEILLYDIVYFTQWISRRFIVWFQESMSAIPLYFSYCIHHVCYVFLVNHVCVAMYTLICLLCSKCYKQLLVKFRWDSLNSYSTK